MLMRMPEEVELVFGMTEWAVDDLDQLCAVLLRSRDRKGSGFQASLLWTSWVGSSLNYMSYRLNLDNTIARSRQSIHAHYDRP